MQRLLLITLFFLLFSCTDKTGNTNNSSTATVQPQNETPEVLDDGKGEIELSSKRYRSNIIEDLFAEAKDKDKQLSDLAENIDAVARGKADRLEKYSEYQRNNNLYWSTVSTYINQVKDSTAKREMKSFFLALESHHRSRISDHENALADLVATEQILADQEILMKLVVTEPMMSSYQLNELPDVGDINKITNEYNSLIERTKKYTSIIK